MTLKRKKDIVGWIKNHYPKSCIAYDYKDQPVDEFCPDADEIISFFYNEDLGLCGCGYPEYSKRYLYKVLKTVNDEHWFRYGSDHQSEETIALIDIMLKTLDHHGFIYHNSSVGCCGITEKGKMFLDALEEKFENPENKEES